MDYLFIIVTIFVYDSFYFAKIFFNLWSRKI